MRHSEPTVLPHHVSLGEHFSSGDRDTLDADAIIRFTQRSWRVCLIWLGAGLCASIAFLAISPAYYTAYSTILFYDSASRPATGAGSASDPLASAAVDTQIQVLQSAEVVGRVVDQNRLIEDQEFGVGHVTTTPQARHATILGVMRALSVRRIGLSDAVTVGFTSKTRLRSAVIANAIIQAYAAAGLDLQRRDRAEAASELRELAEARNKAFASDPTTVLSPTAPQSAGEARARFRELQDRMEAYRVMYNNLMQRVNKASGLDFSSLSVRVLTPAEPPLGRSWPKLIFVFGIAVAVTGAAGFGHALLREATNRSLRTMDEVRQFTGLDCVGGIPKIEERGWITGAVDVGGLQPAYLNASADFCQAIVRLAVRLQEPKQRQFVIGVVAPTAGVGSSSVSAHLANILAEGGQKTLLVDANWQKAAKGLAVPMPSPNRMLARGLAAIHLEPGKLDVLVLRATAPISPLNASNSIASALQHLQAEYDFVVIDFRSIDQTADLDVNLAIVNRVVVIVEAGQTTAESLGGLLRVLPKDKIEAVMVNKITPRSPDLTAEFAGFVEPLIGVSRTALALLDRLAAGQTKFLHRTKYFRTWLHRAARRCRKQIRRGPLKGAPAE